MRSMARFTEKQSLINNHLNGDGLQPLNELY